MNLKSRLPRLEADARCRARELEQRPLPEEDFLAEFEKLGRQGPFDDEQYFPAALAFYREALREAAAGDPPFDPPPDFLPEMQYLP